MDEMTKTETMTHAEMMATMDGAIRLWAMPEFKTAKIVRNGRTLARIDGLTDGTFWCTQHSTELWGKSTRIQVASWEAASAWLTQQTLAASLSAILSK